MKKIILTTLACALSLGSINARTWTSADGNNTFIADYVSHTDEFVTVMKGFKKVRFKTSLLSDADRNWLDEKKAAAQKKDSETETAVLGKIGEKLQGSLTRFDGKRYAKLTLEKKPVYYLVYFSASW